MQIDRFEFERLLGLCRERGLLSAAEIAEVATTFDQDYPFVDVVAAASSVHLHIKVGEAETLPRADIRAAGGTVENEQAGYIKFAHGCGLNLIFSSIPVALDDLLRALPKPDKPFLDHIGIDLRNDNAQTRALIAGIPAAADALAWKHVAQGGPDRGVYCCHTEVAAKLWLFPREHPRIRRPVEFALGALKLHAGKMGCDLRPADPAIARPGVTTCCAGKRP